MFFFFNFLGKKNISFQLYSMQIFSADTTMFLIFFVHESMKKPTTKVDHNWPIYFYNANRPESSSNLNTCSIKTSHRGIWYWPGCLKGLLSPLYYKTGSIRCLGLHFSDRTVRLIEIFAKNLNQVV